MLFKKKDGKKEAKQAAKHPGKKGVKTHKPEKLTDGEVKQHLVEGWIRCIVIFELAGKPKEHIEETLKAYMENIKRDERVALLAEEYADTEEHEDGMFSTFCETEMLVVNAEVLTWLAINFSPASIEILEPQELRLSSGDLTSWYNDLLSKLHEVSNVLREERSINGHLTESLNALIKNAVKLALRIEDRDAAGIEEYVGIPAKQLEPFLKHLVEKKEIEESDGTYRLA